MYSPDMAEPFDYGTTVNYTCADSFYLEGNQIRTCQGDDSSVNGMWSGSDPVCAGTEWNLQLLSVFWRGIGPSTSDTLFC